MSCDHLRQLFELCDQNGRKLSSSDLVHVVCKQCRKGEGCPSMLFEEYEAQHPELEARKPKQESEKTKH